jgi:hypothetical protein
MFKSSVKTKSQSLCTLLLLFICACPVARTQTAAAEQQLLRSLKSGDQADLRAALAALAQKAITNASTTPAAAPESALQDDRGDRHHPEIVTIDPPGSAASLAIAINNAGEIIGYYADSAQNVRGFLRYPDGTYVVVAPPGARVGPQPNFFTVIWSINDGETSPERLPTRVAPFTPTFAPATESTPRSMWKALGRHAALSA